jgi:hypothetical protein
MLSEEEKELFNKLTQGSDELKHNLRLWLNIMEFSKNEAINFRFGRMNPHFPMSPGDDPSVRGPGDFPSFIVGTHDDDNWAYRMWMREPPMGGVHVHVPYRNYVDLEGGPMESAIVGFAGGEPQYGIVPSKYHSSGLLRYRPNVDEVTIGNTSHSISLDVFKSIEDNLETGVKSIRRQFLNGLIMGVNPEIDGKTLIIEPKKFDSTKLQQSGVNKQTSKKHKKRRRH